MSDCKFCDEKQLTRGDGLPCSRSADYLHLYDGTDSNNKPIVSKLCWQHSKMERRDKKRSMEIISVTSLKVCKKAKSRNQAI